MTTTTQRMRAWTGPALFSYGFRPFFFGASLWASLAMCLWMMAFFGTLRLPSAFDPVLWHAHEFLFGYLGAVIAGFMMTAVPNWTGRMPIVGWPLAGLFFLWVAGRLIVLMSEGISPVLVALTDLSFMALLGLAMSREIIAGKNWRNLVIVGLLGAFLFANALFHWEAAQGDYAAHGFGLRIGLGTAVVLIALIGGRIVPSFTRNWLAKRGDARLPTPPMQRLDRIAVLTLIATMSLWVAVPTWTGTALALLCVAGLHFLRMMRWRGVATGAEPLVWVLHIAYLFVPLGAAFEGLAILFPQTLAAAPALHVWTIGAIGLMTLAVMTRATLGHTGQALAASTGTFTLYSMMIASTLTRVGAGFWPDAASVLLSLSAFFWMGAFLGFAFLYGPLLLRPKEVT